MGEESVENEGDVVEEEGRRVDSLAQTSIEQTVTLYDSEAVTESSAMTPARGLAAIRARWVEAFAQPGFSLTWKADKVVVTESGMIACSSESWRMAGPNATCPYLEVWRRQADGQWKVLIDAAWYSSAPE